MADPPGNQTQFCPLPPKLANFSTKISTLLFAFASLKTQVIFCSVSPRKAKVGLNLGKLRLANPFPEPANLPTLDTLQPVTDFV